MALASMCRGYLLQTCSKVPSGKVFPVCIVDVTTDFSNRRSDLLTVKTTRVELKGSCRFGETHASSQHKQSGKVVPHTSEHVAVEEGYPVEETRF